MVKCKFVVGVLFARGEGAKMDYTFGLLQGFALKLRVKVLNVFNFAVLVTLSLIYITAFDV